MFVISLILLCFKFLKRIRLGMFKKKKKKKRKKEKRKKRKGKRKEKDILMVRLLDLNTKYEFVTYIMI